MALERYMFDEAFDFHDPFGNEGKKSSYSNPPQVERWQPLGAASTEENPATFRENESSKDECQHLLELEKEQEKLNASLMALTSHFAQVQFRLKQIVSAPKTDQEKLLRELEDFAFIGCPETVGPDESKLKCVTCTTHLAYECYDKRVTCEKERQKNLADQLRMLLNELEKYAAKQKDAKVNLFEDKTPSSKSDKNRYIVEQLRSKLNMSTEEFQSMSPEEMKNQIDKAMAKLVNPGKAKEQLITQLSTQIKDMENFVEFLKDNQQLTIESDKEKVEKDYKNSERESSARVKAYSYPNAHSASPSTMRKQENSSGIPAPHIRFMEISEEKRKRLHEASMAVIRKTLAVLQIFAISQFGCSAKHFEEHMMRKAAATAASAGYQKPLNTLKAAVSRIVSIHEQLKDLGLLFPDSDDELPRPANGKVWPRSRMSSSSTAMRSRATSVVSIHTQSSIDDDQLDVGLKEELVAIVRGELAPSLRDLLQHGLCRTIEHSVLSTKSLLGCISDKSARVGTMHAWELFSNFYKMKHGNNFNDQPNVKLSESFGIDLGGTQETPRQSLLIALHQIKSSHEPRKRSYDSMFRALICAGLNRQKLLLWVRLVLRCPEMVDKHYERWSFVARTGFDEVLAELEKLADLNFFLPENLAIRHLVKSFNEFGDP
ncbi:RUN domain-containing protein 1-like isoform X2 [Rhopilema esculentum]|uniref:RUN domain-containing protein 1-like isoform X2 n=1 Tax=Rhopilema esculentum TaxID=499914 RepID=UPI0031D5F791